MGDREPAEPAGPALEQPRGRSTEDHKGRLQNSLPKSPGSATFPRTCSHQGPCSRSVGTPTPKEARRCHGRKAPEESAQEAG